MIDPFTGEDTGPGTGQMGDWWSANAPEAVAPVPPPSTTRPPGGQTTDTGWPSPPTRQPGAQATDTEWPPPGPLQQEIQGDLRARIGAALAAAQSTDDPDYWYRKISADPQGATSAWPYWQDRIARGDGALAVRQGSLSRFNDTPSTGFGVAPAPYQSAPSSVPPYTTPPLPAELQAPFQVPAPPAELQRPFQPPSVADLRADPGYLARIDLANRGLERSAAARGSVLSGGFQEALAKYNQDYASNEYGNLFARGLQGRQQQMGEYGTRVAQGLQGRQQQVGEYQTNVGNTGAQYQNRYQAYLNDQGRLLQDYLTNYNVKRGTERDYWDRVSDLYRGGLRAASEAQPR